MLWDWLLCVAIAILGTVVIFGGSSSIIVIIFIVIVLVIKLVFWSVGAYGGDETSQLKDEIEALKRRLELQKIEHKQEQHWAVKENMTIIGSFWPNFAPKKEDDKSEADDMAVATQKSEELFENAEGQSENETPEVEEPEGEETPEVENKKPPRNSKKGAELLNAKPKAASSKAKAKAKAKAASSKMKAAPKKRVDPKRKAKAAPKRKRNQVKRPAAVDDLEASSEHEKAVDAESSEEIQEISGYGSDATATTLPLTPRAGTLQSERDSNKPKGRKPKDPKVEVDKSSGCSKCRWSKRGCAKCRGQATK
eukprot:symbB.v1.2.006395.t1/scaffold358.1/size381540/18